MEEQYLSLGYYYMMLTLKTLLKTHAQLHKRPALLLLSTLPSFRALAGL
jgi:hypothetical protein